MALGLLVIILGIWVFVNGLNGNLAGLFNNKTKFDIFPAPNKPSGTAGTGPSLPQPNAGGGGGKGPLVK